MNERTVTRLATTVTVYHDREGELAAAARWTEDDE